MLPARYPDQDQARAMPPNWRNARWAKPATRFITAARALQELLGTHQDAIQAERQLRQFLQDSPSPRAGFLSGRMVERQHHRRQIV
ncbi:MAG: hypothetical protein AB7P24_16325 [Nitrospira sp.]